MSCFFRPSPPRSLVDGVGAGEVDPLATEDARLPDPTLSFYAPHKVHMIGTMDFMLLKNEEEKCNKVVATDHKGRCVLYDLDLHAVRAMPNLIAPKYRSISLTVGNTMYILDRIPGVRYGRRKQSLEALTFCQPRCGYADWKWRSLEPPPFVYDPFDDHRGGPSRNIDSFAVVAGSNVCISTSRAGTYSFDTKKRKWINCGDWALPFSGLAEYVPEHKLWFGLSPDSEGNLFCASDLAAVSEVSPPWLHTVWKDATPPVEGKLVGSSAVHLGSSRFCIARFFQVASSHANENSLEHYLSAETFVVLTGVEVERHGEVLHAVKHKSESYKLADDRMVDWVF